MFCLLIVVAFSILNSCDITSAAPNRTPLLIKQVPFGEDVVLTCHSNEENFNFWYWQVVEKNILIGVNQNYDKIKYNFEILTGNLTIREVTKDEEGLYTCVSSGVTKKERINVKSVKVIVQLDWEEVYEHDSSVNSFRIVIIIVALLILCGVLFLIYNIWTTRYRYPSYLQQLEDDDEDSGEEIFSAPGPSRIVRERSKDRESDNPTISTDFKSILDIANGK